MNKKHILLVTPSYPPEIRSASHLIFELANDLIARNYQVTVITTYPKVNLADTGESQNIPESTVESDIRVLRIKTLPIFKIGFLLRGISILLLPWYFRRGIKKHLDQGVDSVLVYSPPLPLALVGEWVAKKYGAQYVLNVQDLFPQNAIDLGILKNPLLIRFFKWLERRSYRRADHVTVHSEGNLDFLLNGRYLSESKSSILHNWIDTDPFDGASNGGTFRQQYNLNGKFIFLFAGVVGPAQGLDVILEVAHRVRDLEDIVFLIVGDGTEKENMAEQAKSRGLNNIHFQPFVNKEEYPFLVKEADVGLVCLSSQMQTPVVPGKLQGYMASAIPVLGILNSESDGFSIIKDANCGFAVLADEIDVIVERVIDLYRLPDEDRQKLGQSGRDFVNDFFTKEVCVSQLEQIFNKLPAQP